MDVNARDVTDYAKHKCPGSQAILHAKPDAAPIITSTARRWPEPWHGKGAERLGLSGEVKDGEFFAMCDNTHPFTSEQLTPRNKENRRVAFDFTFSAPKSVSVYYECSKDDRVIDAIRSSVNDTMQELEREMKTRVRVKGSSFLFADVHPVSQPVGLLLDSTATSVCRKGHPAHPSRKATMGLTLAALRAGR